MKPSPYSRESTDDAKQRTPTVSARHSRSAGSTYWLRQPEQADVQDIHAWLARPAINQWFDFGLGRQTLSALAVQLMLQSERHRLRVFGPRGHARASGLVAVSELNHAFGTASFWVLRDRDRPACPDMTFLAARAHLEEAFRIARLRSISAWAAEANERSQRLLTRLGFQRLGVQRACHVIEGVHGARVLYDMLPEELCSPAIAPERHE